MLREKNFVLYLTPFLLAFLIASTPLQNSAVQGANHTVETATETVTQNVVVPEIRTAIGTGLHALAGPCTCDEGNKHECCTCGCQDDGSAIIK